MTSLTEVTLSAEINCVTYKNDILLCKKLTHMLQKKQLPLDVHVDWICRKLSCIHAYIIMDVIVILFSTCQKKEIE